MLIYTFTANYTPHMHTATRTYMGPHIFIPQTHSHHFTHTHTLSISHTLAASHTFICTHSPSHTLSHSPISLQVSPEEQRSKGCGMQFSCLHPWKPSSCPASRIQPQAVNTAGWPGGDLSLGSNWGLLLEDSATLLPKLFEAWTPTPKSKAAAPGASGLGQVSCTLPESTLVERSQPAMCNLSSLQWGELAAGDLCPTPPKATAKPCAGEGEVEG